MFTLLIAGVLFQDWLSTHNHKIIKTGGGRSKKKLFISQRLMQVFNRCFTIKIFPHKSQLLKNLKPGTPTPTETLEDFKAGHLDFPNLWCGRYRCSFDLTSLFAAADSARPQRASASQVRPSCGCQLCSSPFTNSRLPASVPSSSLPASVPSSSAKPSLRRDLWGLSAFKTVGAGLQRPGSSGEPALPELRSANRDLLRSSPCVYFGAAPSILVKFLSGSVPPPVGDR
ncbi:uncharacterized protein LOC115072696 [Nannospalax galili]|uniref:uncharacterized protein LOC115072696 n=1 Tax=Nannospalax galili TaxID=1026970 RepID=UPI00111C0447|nr:uncharacterized protein LOC115072696 [Nannospalax galili]